MHYRFRHSRCNGILKTVDRIQISHRRRYSFDHGQRSLRLHIRQQRGVTQRNRPHQERVHHLLPVMSKALVEIQPEPLSRQNARDSGPADPSPTFDDRPLSALLSPRKRSPATNGRAKDTASRTTPSFPPPSGTSFRCARRRGSDPAPHLHGWQARALPPATPHRVAPSPLGNDVRGGFECFPGVILQAHLFRADGGSSRIAGNPTISRRQLAIAVKAGVQRSQHVNHVVCHLAGNAGPVIAVADFVATRSSNRRIEDKCPAVECR